MKEKRLSHQEIARFCRGLSLLLHAGIPLGEGISLLAEEEEKGAYRLCLEEMAGKMDAGSPLAEAMEEIGGFPAYVTGMTRMGERSGRLEEALNALAVYYEEKEQMDRQLRNALTYPAIVMLLMLVVIGVLLIRVLPVFDEVYASLGGRLTGMAGGLLSLGYLLKKILPSSVFCWRRQRFLCWSLPSAKTYGRKCWRAGIENGATKAPLKNRMMPVLPKLWPWG